MQLRRNFLTTSIAAALLVAVGCRPARQPQAALSAPAAGSSERWELRPGHGTCEISFTFPEPHDIYSGEVRIATGWVELDGDGRLCGQFVVRIADVDMGEADLTQNVRYASEMLRGEDFPESSFEFAGAAAPHPLPEKDPMTVTLDGTFWLKGVAVDLSVPAQFSRSPGRDDGSVELRGALELDQLRERFGIVGPGADGDPCGNRLKLAFRFVLGRCPA